MIIVSNMSNATLILKKTFIPPSGRDTSLDFTNETNEILQNEAKYKFTPNLSPEELKL